jgi:hypothetical protein
VVVPQKQGRSYGNSPKPKRARDVLESSDKVEICSAEIGQR